jgi:hypothetical protein
MAHPRAKNKISPKTPRFGARRVMKSAKRVKGRPIIGESRTEEIEKALGSTGGSAPMVELEEDFSEKYGR